LEASKDTNRPIVGPNNENRDGNELSKKRRTEGEFRPMGEEWQVKRGGRKGRTGFHGNWKADVYRGTFERRVGKKGGGSNDPEKDH